MFRVTPRYHRLILNKALDIQPHSKIRVILSQILLKGAIPSLVKRVIPHKLKQGTLNRLKRVIPLLNQDIPLLNRAIPLLNQVTPSLPKVGTQGRVHHPNLVTHNLAQVTLLRLTNNRRISNNINLTHLAKKLPQCHRQCLRRKSRNPPLCR